MSRMNKPRSLPKKPQSHLIPEEGQINFAQCCSFNPPQEWKIIAKAMSKPTKRFINITVNHNHKNPPQSHRSSSRAIQSKNTMSRQLSHQSSRELFETAKKDFIEQLKLWKEEDTTVSLYQKSDTKKTKNSKPQNTERYRSANPEETGECFYWEEENENGENRSPRNWMMPDLNSIEEVGVNLETTEGLRTQYSEVFEG